MKNSLYTVFIVFVLKTSPLFADYDLKMCVNSALITNAEIQKARADFAAYKESEIQSYAAFYHR